MDDAGAVFGMTRRTAMFGIGAACFPNMALADTALSWKARRDARVVKQQLDYSCGAASVATILREFYSLGVSEADVLARLARDGRYSFTDLAAVVEHWGLAGGGVALGFDKLREIKIPVVAYLKYRGRDHFTVLRGVNPQTGLVQVADPSWGNRTFKPHQFRAMWEVRDQVGAEGKLLLIVPRGQTAIADIDHTFFTNPGGWSAALTTVRLGASG